MEEGQPPLLPALPAPHTPHLVATTHKVFQSFSLVARLLAEVCNLFQHLSVWKEVGWIAWLQWLVRRAAGAGHGLANSQTTLKCRKCNKNTMLPYFILVIVSVILDCLTNFLIKNKKKNHRSLCPSYSSPHHNFDILCGFLLPMSFSSVPAVLLLCSPLANQSSCLSALLPSWPDLLALLPFV